MTDQHIKTVRETLETEQVQAEAEDFFELPDPVAYYGVEDCDVIDRLGKQAQVLEFI